MKVAIVILNWNGKELLEKFLPSVVKYSCLPNGADSAFATIYVADNASTDDSVAFITQFFPQVVIIQNKENHGYAKGYNTGLQNLDEDIFVLLNSDVEVTENWLNPIITEFNKDQDLVAAQPKILDYKKKTHFEYAGAAGGFLDKFGYPFCRGRIFDKLEQDTGQYNDTVEIFWATGACLFIRRNAFWDVAGFDEDFFAHQEEIDLCWRLKSKGGSIKYIGGSTVFHVGGATLDAASPQKTFYNFRNSLLTLLKNIKGNKAGSIIFIRMILDAIAAIKFVFEGKPNHFVSILKAHFSFYLLLPKFWAKRKNNSSDTKYYKIKSIVFQHFILKISIFNNLRLF